MQVHRDYSLKSLNTFGVEARAKLFVRFEDTDVLAEALALDQRRMILGGGSNMLFTKDFDGLVLKNEISGIEILEEDSDSVLVQAGAGENWHAFVRFCIENNWAGLENLSLIPGNVGAAPMQNIGAYGVELKEHFAYLEAYEIASGKIKSFDKSACEFDYRSSIFKTWAKGEYVICKVAFRLSKQASLNTSYGAINQELERLGIEQPGIKDVSRAVINIRQSKLPDPRVIGNAGSFFKNPVVDKSFLKTLQLEYPDMPSYAAGENLYKVPAGWLIERAGWKGKRFGNYGIHEKQALVLVNYGGSSGAEIFQLSADILQDIRDKFGITLEREVNII